MPLSDGKLIAVHTAADNEEESGLGGLLNSTYEFRLKTLSKQGNGDRLADRPLTPGISKNIEFWDPDTKITYTGVLWELNPVEVRARTRPARLQKPLEGPEAQVFAQAGVDVNELRAFLEANKLALFVTRDVTTLVTQPTSSSPSISRSLAPRTRQLGRRHDLRRRLSANLPGRSVARLDGLLQRTRPRPVAVLIAQNLHDAAAVSANPALSGAPVGSVKVASDG